MRVIEHKNIVKPNAMTLQTVPLVVWLDKYTEMHIMKGDSIADVAHEVRAFWRDMPDADLFQLIAFWFALGERVIHNAVGPWERRELRANPKRRYQKDL